MTNYGIQAMIKQNLEHKNNNQIEAGYHLEIIHNKGEQLTITKDSMAFIIAEGDVALDLEGKIVKLTTKNIIIIKNGNVRLLELLSEECSVVCLHINSTLINDNLKTDMADCPIFYDFLRLKASRLEYLLFDLTLVEHVMIYIKLMLLEASYPVEEKRVSTHQKNVHATMVLLLTKLHEDHQKSLIISESTMMEDYNIGKILKYMSANYATVNLSTVAEEFNFHPAYFSSRFKKLAECSFSEKLLQIRLEQARRLLATTETSIQEIIETVGFSEKSYFYRVFKKHYKMTPLEYRRQNQ